MLKGFAFRINSWLQGRVRETPELPMQALFRDIEIGVLEDFACENRLKVPDNVGAGVLTMAIIAGCTNRKNDLPPGYKKIWEGYVRLVNMSQAHELAYRRMTRKQGWLNHKVKF